HVWQRNNLAQKNITIVDALAGRMLEFRFRIGTAFASRKGGQLVVRRVNAVDGTKVFRDAANIAGVAAAVSPAETMDVLLLEPTSVTVNVPSLTRPDERLTIRLPAETQLTLGRPLPAVIEGAFEPVAIGGKKLLAMPAKAKSATLRLPELRKPSELAMHVELPKN